MRITEEELSALILKRQPPVKVVKKKSGYIESVVLQWFGGTAGRPSPITEFERAGGREVECDFRGISHGVSARVDRLKSLGNAIVPQIAYEIFKAIEAA